MRIPSNFQVLFLCRLICGYRALSKDDEGCITGVGNTITHGGVWLAINLWAMATASQHAVCPYCPDLCTDSVLGIKAQQYPNVSKGVLPLYPLIQR